jgi:hypothetical protein
MKIKAIIESVRADMEKKLPTLFQSEEVKSVDHFTIGYPSNQEQTFCCVRLASLDKKLIEFIIHLALPKVHELVSYGYIQAVNRYLDDGFDPSVYGFDTVDYELHIFETDFMQGDIQILFSVTLTRFLDDCD